MLPTTWDGITLEQYRRFYGEKICAVSNFESAALANAFAHEH